MNIYILLLIGISLSMDSFSFALSIGTYYNNKKDFLLYSLIVGIFHFFMPFFGSLFGNALQKIVYINPNKLLFFLFIFIGIEMILDLFNKKENKIKISLLNMILFAFTVSLDSFTIGIGINNITTVPILGYLIFMLCSSLITYIGLELGKFSYNKFGILAKLIGIIIIIILAFSHLLK